MGLKYPLPIERFPASTPVPISMVLYFSDQRTILECMWRFYLEFMSHMEKNITNNNNNNKHCNLYKILRSFTKTEVNFSSFV